MRRTLHVLPSALLFVTALTAACADEAPAPQASPVAEDGAVQLTEQQVQVAGLEWSPASVTSLRQAVTVPASVIPPDTAQASIGSIVEGRVVRVRVVPGDRVRAGTPLVEIHTHELSDAEAALTEAEAMLDYRTEAASRAERLYEAGAVALEELQRRRAELRGAQAELERAVEMVEHLHPSPDGNATAVAPRAGVVFAVEARPGQAVVPGDPLLTMGATDPLWVTAFIPEGTSAALAVGDEVEVSFRSPAGARASARLVRMGEFVDPANRSVEVRFELLDPPAGVHPGAFASVDVSTTAPFMGVELPEDAAVRIAGEDMVFLAEGGGRFRPQPVEVVAIRPGVVAVLGLEPGAQVVTAGAYFLKSTLEAASAEGETE